MKTLEELLNNEYKVYVEVTEIRTAEGELIPLSFIWKHEEEGDLYCEIIAVKEKRRTFSRRAGGYGLRYQIEFMVEDEPEIYTKYMFYEMNRPDCRWFMERKIC